jgi:hypothetical protein
MGVTDISPSNKAYLVTKAKDPFLNGAVVKVVTKQANGLRNEAIRHAINVAHG